MSYKDRKFFSEEKKIKAVDKKKKSFLPVRNLGEIEDQFDDEALSQYDVHTLHTLHKIKEYI